MNPLNGSVGADGCCDNIVQNGSSIRSQTQINLSDHGDLNYEPTAEDFAELDAWREEYGLNDNLGSDNPYFIPRYNMMNNYPRLATWPVLGQMMVQTVGDPYYIVCAPKNKKYNSNKCLMDHIRKRFSKNATEMIITREIRSTKCHYNVLVRSIQELDVLHHEKQDSRFFYYVQAVPDTFKDLRTVHQYMIKESMYRYFNCCKKKNHLTFMLCCI